VPKPFDVTTKYLVENRPADWLAYCGLNPTEVEVIEADLSAVSAEADKVLRVKAPDPWLVHLEFQASYDVTLGERTLQYSVLLHRRLGLPVQSIVVLLRPEADGAEMTGGVRHQLPGGTTYLEFAYQIVRAWQKPVENLLTAGLGTLPMAPLADIAQEALPDVIHRMEERIRQEATPNEAGILWTATYILMGLRYSAEFTRQLLQGVRAMKESTTYQAILEEGRIEGEARGKIAEARTILLRLGSKHLGTPSEATRIAIESISSIERLERLTDRLSDVSSWEELMSLS
jgi:predicted transposase YdaD